MDPALPRSFRGLNSGPQVCEASALAREAGAQLCVLVMQTHLLSLSSLTAPGRGSADPGSIWRHMGNPNSPPSLTGKQSLQQPGVLTACVHTSAALLSPFPWWEHILTILFASETTGTLLTPHLSVHSCQVQSRGSQ